MAGGVPSKLGAPLPLVALSGKTAKCYCHIFSYSSFYTRGAPSHGSQDILVCLRFTSTGNKMGERFTLMYFGG